MAPLRTPARIPTSTSSSSQMQTSTMPSAASKKTSPLGVESSASAYPAYGRYASTRPTTARAGDELRVRVGVRVALELEETPLGQVEHASSHGGSG